jgi:hypothetical protein
MSHDFEAGRTPAPAMKLRAGQIRYSLNWQGTAIRVQYERLAENMNVNPEESVLVSMNAHMRAIIDLDFLITSVRRLLRVAEQARRFGLDPGGELKLAIRIFKARWLPHLVDIRNTLEHVDGHGIPFVPVSGGDAISFAHPNGQIDASKLYIDAKELHKEISRTIEHFED